MRDVYGFVPSAVYHRNKAPPPVSEDEILKWADAYFARHGDWPIKKSGDIPEAPGETWSKVNSALIRGGPRSARRLFADAADVGAAGQALPQGTSPLTEEQILGWADTHFARTGTWPASRRAPVVDAPGENWGNILKACAVATEACQAAGR